VQQLLDLPSLHEVGLAEKKAIISEEEMAQLKTSS